MHERVRLAALHRVRAAQALQKGIAEFDLALALEADRASEQALIAARADLESTFEDWSARFHGQAIDVARIESLTALTGLCEAKLMAAQQAEAETKRLAAASQLEYGRCNAALATTSKRMRRLAKQIEQGAEEKSLADLERRTCLGWRSGS